MQFRCLSLAGSTANIVRKELTVVLAFGITAAFVLLAAAVWSGPFLCPVNGYARQNIEHLE